jgi:outer membrane biosynthesis protein TonB
MYLRPASPKRWRARIERQKRYRSCRRQAAVILIVTVNGESNVLAVVVEKAEPPGWFESAAVSAFRWWKYKPTGRTRLVRVVVAFELAD